MPQVLSGFATIAIVIAIGFFVGKANLLGKHAQFTLQMYVYFLATPALLLDKLYVTDPLDVLGPQLAVASGSALTIGLIYFLWARTALHRPIHESAVGGLASSYCNASNLGIPVAAHVVGDSTVVVPTLLFQIAFYGPIVLAMLDVVTAKEAHADGRAGRVNTRSLFITPFKNPMLLGALTGLVISILHAHAGVSVPHPLVEPVHLIGQSAVPVALIAFGMSLAGQKVLDPSTSPRLEVGVASATKILGQPLAAFLIAHFVFGMTGHALFAACVVATLPTAQNVYTYATRYGRGLILARDAGVITTAASFVMIMLLALVFT
ncbi:AEC family transporter [Corynebacterium parakroppenstedtii]|uniref:AEC family transporter n=1 Tax=Corynebacterium parakroppenstedtii TaxID=2828363 RepID=UPI001C8F2C75|nr:AEC family transporter [Corynebacterium parakroppenstedtii]MBY0795718.1 AEC family transporter [Corynebacterium parakroppenstedtii]